MKRLLAILILPVAGCAQRETPQPATPAAGPPPAAASSLGNAEKGKMLAGQYGCNVCHVTPGVDGPQGSLGPSLAGVASRPTISNGVIQNTPENMARYIENPPALNPQSTMPPLGVSTEDARDIAAYLGTLK